MPLCVFQPEGSTLHRAVYNSSSSRHYKGPAGDHPDRVVNRARSLLRLGELDYDVLEQSCETVAFWCKTGLRYSGQAQVAQDYLGYGTLATAATGALWVITDTALGVTAAAAAGTLSAVSVVGIVVPAVALTVFGVYSLFRYLQRRRLNMQAVKHPLDVIDLIMRLNPRMIEKMHRIQTNTFDGNQKRDLDFVVARLKAMDTRIIPESQDMLTFIWRLFSGVAHDVALEFMIQALARQSVFNAVLDLPAGIFDQSGLASDHPREVSFMDTDGMSVKLLVNTNERLDVCLNGEIILRDLISLEQQGRSIHFYGIPCHHKEDWTPNLIIPGKGIVDSIPGRSITPEIWPFNADNVVSEVMELAMNVGLLPPVCHSLKVAEFEILDRLLETAQVANITDISVDARPLQGNQGLDDQLFRIITKNNGKEIVTRIASLGTLKHLRSVLIEFCVGEVSKCDQFVKKATSESVAYFLQRMVELGQGPLRESAPWQSVVGRESPPVVLKKYLDMLTATEVSYQVDLFLCNRSIYQDLCFYPFGAWPSDLTSLPRVVRRIRSSESEWCVYWDPGIGHVRKRLDVTEQEARDLYESVRDHNCILIQHSILVAEARTKWTIARAVANNSATIRRLKNIAINDGNLAPAAPPPHAPPVVEEREGCF